MKRKTSFSYAEDARIRRNYLKIPIKALGDKMDRSYTGIMGRLKAMRLEIPADIIQKNKAVGRIKSGHIPFNKGLKQSEYMTAETIARTKKTRFKKGNIPANAKDRDGVITVRYDHKHRNGKPYKYIRLSLGNWYPYHQYKWEKKYGKVKRGFCLWFKDGNTLNCTLKNLELITRAENMARNTIQRYPKDLQLSMKLISKINKKLKKNEQQTN